MGSVFLITRQPFFTMIPDGYISGITERKKEVNELEQIEMPAPSG
jgi:hypothetical protein